MTNPGEHNPSLIHIGRDTDSDQQIYVPIDLFRLHTVIRGMTGARKTLWVVYLALQLMRRGAVYYVDFGEDRFAFHTLSEVAGEKFQFFSTGANEGWTPFNPMEAFCPLTPSKVIKAADYFVTSLSLHHGEGYGKSYFGDIARQTFIDAFTELLEQGITDPTRNELAAAIVEVSQKYRRNEVAHASMVLSQLALYPQLADEGDNCIDFGEVIEHRRFVYAFLSGLREPMSAKLGGLLTWAAVAAATQRRELGMPDRELYLIVDEFVNVSTSLAFQNLVVLARKFGIHLLLTHQSSEQLRGGGEATDMRPIIRDNTAVKLYLTFSGRDDIQELQNMSHDVIRPQRSQSVRNMVLSNTVSEKLEPEIERNEVLDVSAFAGDGFLAVNTGKGHEEPRRIRFDPILFPEYFTHERHTELSRRVLPQRQRPLKADSPESERKVTPGRQVLHDAIRLMVETKRKAESFELG